MSVKPVSCQYTLTLTASARRIRSTRKKLLNKRVPTGLDFNRLDGVSIIDRRTPTSQRRQTKTKTTRVALHPTRALYVVKLITRQRAVGGFQSVYYTIIANAPAYFVQEARFRILRSHRPSRGTRVWTPGARIL
ncbi:hypothetical protein N7519_005395 [Penicillium mononematosum]|uniref:uncharacterized protein n=1 Tax=Penicillium mononematosum TaxID=268346 RepID=UPI00254693AC|nr:uncharacterized protein N7519_005395 [Penicillium mononematosum]KAJ6184094.1 hypothetical protein N7519_005395 [Penicillium mononematosum]